MCPWGRLYPPLCRFRHQLNIQRAAGEVVAVCARLAVKACAESVGRRRPVQQPYVLRQNTVQHLQVLKLRPGGGGAVLGGGPGLGVGPAGRLVRERDAQPRAEQGGAQVYGDHLPGEKYLEDN